MSLDRIPDKVAGVLTAAAMPINGAPWNRVRLGKIARSQ
jgi:hypothetical protein